MTDADAFDRLVAAADAAMIVVTTVSGDGERSGCLVGFHSQCSIDPRQYAVWISRENHTFRVARQAETLAVHFLAQGDKDVASLFGSNTGDDIDKFERCTWARGPDGLPLLDRVPNRFIGAIVGTIDEGGDHVCFVVTPTGAGDHLQSFEPFRFDDVRDLDPGHPA